jgi:hypothetical protein
MEIRFSRHAKNKLRLYKLTLKDVEDTINSGERLNQEDKWESQYRKLKVIWVMVGTYALVITIIRSR